MQRSRRKRIVYWDTCIFIAWMTAEPRQDREIDGVIKAVGEVEASRMTVVTSEVTRRREISAAKNSKRVMDQLVLFMRRRNIEEVALDPWIEALAEDLRQHYAGKHARDGKGKLTENDSLHLATAILYGVDSFYTFDDGKKGGRSLLSLDGDVAGHDLHICKPPVEDLWLFGDG